MNVEKCIDRGKSFNGYVEKACYNIYIFNSLNLYILGSQGMKCITRLDIFLYFSAFYITILHYLKNQKLS